MINLEWFRTFSAIFECGNITEASRVLNMTQPGVSKHLAALEHHIGKKLFDRTTRKIMPTEYGKFLYAQVTNPIKALEKVERYSNKNLKKQRAAIVIGTNNDFFKKILSDKIYQLDMYITLCFGTQQELAEALENNKIQLLAGVHKYDTFPHSFTPLGKENLVLVASNKVAIPESSSTDNTQIVKWLNKQTWFSYDNDMAYINKFWQANFHTKPPIVVRYVLPSLTDIVEGLQHTEGVCVLPSYVCQQAINTGRLQSPFAHLKPVTQGLFYSCKKPHENLSEIKLFKENINIEL